MIFDNGWWQLERYDNVGHPWDAKQMSGRAKRDPTPSRPPVPVRVLATVDRVTCHWKKKASPNAGGVDSISWSQGRHQPRTTTALHFAATLGPFAGCNSPIQAPNGELNLRLVWSPSDVLMTNRRLKFSNCCTTWQFLCETPGRVQLSKKCPGKNILNGYKIEVSNQQVHSFPSYYGCGSKSRSPGHSQSSTTSFAHQCWDAQGCSWIPWRIPTVPLFYGCDFCRNNQLF